MTSFDCRLEPRPARRLAAAAVLLHAIVAASPWLLGVPPAAAALMSMAALAGLPSTLLCLPGPQHAVAVFALEGSRWRLRCAGEAGAQPAALGGNSRALAGLAFVDMRSGSGRHAWVLTRSSLPPEQFRRLKARIRLS